MAQRKLLRLEHLVRINDPTIPRISWLTRSQLWDGLRHTVAVPQTMDESIDAATIADDNPRRLQRQIRRGSITVADEVELVVDECLTIRADPGGDFSGSTLTIRIEEPAPLVLFVRFIYELYYAEDGNTAEEDNARRAAYQASDLDRVRQARLFVKVH